MINQHQLNMQPAKWPGASHFLHLSLLLAGLVPEATSQLDATRLAGARNIAPFGQNGGLLIAGECPQFIPWP